MFLTNQMPKLFGTDGIRYEVDKDGGLSRNIFRLGQVIGYLLEKSPSKFTNSLSAKLPQGRWITKHHDPTLRSARCNPTFSNTLPCKQGWAPRSTNICHLSPPTKSIVIGMDTRESSSAILNDIIKGIFQIHNTSFAKLGIVPTPLVAYLTRKWMAELGIVISASHNPYNYNGIKLISPEGLKIPDGTEKIIEQMFFDKEFDKKRWTTIEPTVYDASKRVSDYTEDIVRIFRDNCYGTNLKIVVDCANGAVTSLVSQIFCRFSAKIKLVNDKPNGRNINLGCGATSPEVVAKLVIKEGANFGIAFDGDGDRVILADENGKILDGDDILAISARFMKGQNRLPGNTVVSTIMANYGLEEYLKTRGIKLIRVKVGEKNVSSEMLKENVLLGGEPSGHIIYGDLQTTGDGIITALEILSIMAITKKKLSQLAKPLVKYPSIMMNVDVKSKLPLDKLPLVKSAINEGEKLLEKKGRVIVRYSGTEPKARIMVEGQNRELINNIAKKIAFAITSSTKTGCFTGLNR